MKIKKMKDPTLPKKAKSGFMFFCDEYRPALINAYKEKNLKVVIAEVAKELGKKWGKLKTKVKYDKLAATDKERYADAMSEYNEKNGLN